jgi:predicted nuclease with TOPRIM domain
MMHRKFNHLKSSFKAVKQDTSRLEEDLRSVELERESLKDRVEKLKLFEQKYQHYMKREPEIRHYLGQYSMLAK